MPKSTKPIFFVLLIKLPDGSNKWLICESEESAEMNAKELAIAHPDQDVFLLEPRKKYRNKPHVEVEFIY